MKRAPDYLACRTFGHAWFVIPSEGKSAHGGDPLWLRCERCMTERHDSVSFTTGDLMTRQYIYPDQYKGFFDDEFSDHEGSPTRQDFRRLVLIRLQEATRRKAG